MPRKYTPKRGARRIPIDKVNMKSAVNKVLAENGVRATARDHAISTRTLKRYVMKARNSSGEIEYAPNYKRSRVFFAKEEEEIIKKFKEASKLYNGLTYRTARKLAYQYACENRKYFPPNWAEYGSTTYEWLHRFMGRHKGLSLFITKDIGASHAAINVHKVDHFSNIFV